jgi:hypothetical protein
MGTLRLSLVGTVILALLGGASGVVLAQMDADADAVYVTRVSMEPVSADVGSVSETDTLYSSRDGLLVFTEEWSDTTGNIDPRVSGTWNATFNVDADEKTGQGIMWGTNSMENDGGTWEGPCSGIEYEPPGEADYFTVNCWLTGDGDYAGYTFFVQEDGFQYGGPTRVLHGIIYKGQPPTE